MTRLTSKTLSQLPADIAVPAYDRQQPCGVVHLGTGAFHRAHQAWYFDQLLASGHNDWMIQGASLRSGTVADQINPQDGLFTLVVRDDLEDKLQIIGSIRDVLVARDNPRALVRALAHPAVVLVTLTITEKGYCLDPTTGDLNTGDPAIAADIRDLCEPRTAPSFLVAALAERRAAGHAPFTVLSCDNLPGNGQRTRNAVLSLAEAVDPELAKWIEQEVAFPSSMVDRIVPATTDDDLQNIKARTGICDAALVKTEVFTQWVVEDWFCNRRPALETVGVQMTNDVAGWETAKLRLLNGAHSAIAYLGGLAKHEFVHEAIAAPGFLELVEMLWDEAEATLGPVEGLDVSAYRQQLALRFSNTALQHRTHQIAMDGSQKIPQRWLMTIGDYRRLDRGVPKALSLAIAGWMHWQSGSDDSGNRFTVDDPLASATAAAIVAAGGDRRAEILNLLGIRAIFGEHLISDRVFLTQLMSDYEQIADTSAAHAVAMMAADDS